MERGSALQIPTTRTKTQEKEERERNLIRRAPEKTTKRREKEEEPQGDAAIKKKGEAFRISFGALFLALFLGSGVIVQGPREQV